MGEMSYTFVLVLFISLGIHLGHSERPDLWLVRPFVWCSNVVLCFIDTCVCMFLEKLTEILGVPQDGLLFILDGI